MRNIKAMSQKEITSRLNFRCFHGHSGFGHPMCFDRKQGLIEKIAFLDIESTDLTAPWGFILCYVISDEKGHLTKRSITLKDLNKAQFDKNLLKQFCEDIKPYHRIVGHYIGDRRFDIPMLRSRAELWHLPFPLYKFHWMSDTYVILRNKFKLKSNSLRSGCDFFGIKSKEHPIITKYWNDLMTGNPKRMQRALDYILVHCVEDVISTRKLWYRINKYTKFNRSSI